GSSRPAGAGGKPAPIAPDRPLKTHFTKNGCDVRSAYTNARLPVDVLDKRPLFQHALAAVIGRIVLSLSVAMALAIVVASACATQPAAAPPTAAPTPPRTAAATPTSRPTATPPATPTAQPTTTAAPGPGSSPAAACPRVTGGAAGNQAQLVAIRIAHNPGFDRIVFELGPSTAPGAPGIPRSEERRVGKGVGGGGGSACG